MLVFLFMMIFHTASIYTMKSITYKKNHRFFLQKYLSNLEYTALKEYLAKKDTQKYIAQEPLLFDWALKQTDNPLMIKLLIDNGINLDYHNPETNKTVFHLITENARCVDYDVMLALVSRFVTTKDPLELKGLSSLLKKIDDDGQTAYEKGYLEEEIYLNAYGRPYLDVDPLVEIILYKQDRDFLKNCIRPIMDYHNTVISTQKFNVFKGQPPKRRYIHQHNKQPISPIIPSVTIKFLDSTLWKKRFLSNRTNTKLFKKITRYRARHNYDQFPVPQILMNAIAVIKLFLNL